MNRLSGLLSTLIGLAAVGFAIWFLSRPDPPKEAEAGRPPFVLPVTLVTVEVDTLRPTTQLTGTVRSPARAHYGFEIAGQLIALPHKEVEAFEIDDVLARLDDTSEVLAVSEATAALTLAQKELARLEAGTRSEEIDRLEAEVAELDALAALALDDVNRYKPLVDTKVRSEADLIRLQAQLDAANARAKAKAALLAEARAGARSEDLAIAQARVDQAQAKLDVANAAKDKTCLVARTNGIVLTRLATVGDYLSSGTPVLEVLDPTQLEIVVEIPGRFLTQLDPLAPARLSADDLPGWSMQARLDATIPAADERSRNFVGLVRLDDRLEQAAVLQPGMFVRLEVDLRELPGATIVHSDAIRQTPRGPEIVRALAGEPGPEGRPSLTAQVVAVEVVAVAGERTA
ncbi:MAG: efflux RND transporter periplasmic adaptor subunit, partial [Planctomycetota bacterium]|nr:efflux RND transporter periplasmic adaptor subunit [Planctomycetota bacterium]